MRVQLKRSLKAALALTLLFVLTILTPMTESAASSGTTSPIISGPTALILEAGYESTFVQYEVDGYRFVNMDNEIHFISWNSEARGIDISAGLAPGVYPIKLVLWDNGKRITLDVTLTVTTGTAPVYIATFNSSDIGGWTDSYKGYFAEGALVKLVPLFNFPPNWITQYTSDDDIEFIDYDGYTTFIMPGQNVTIKVMYFSIQRLTLQNDGNGTATFYDDTDKTPDENLVPSGKKITLTATPNDGYVFKEWVVVSGSVEFEDTSAATTSFIMPASDVSIKAVFERAPSYLVMIGTNGNGTATFYDDNGTTSDDVLVGTKITLLATPNDGYVFSKWYVLPILHSVEIDDITAATTSFIMPAGNVAIAAIFRNANPIKGDVNDNGIVDIKDILLVRNIIFGKEYDSYVMKYADVNGDGKVDITDILCIRDIIFGITTA